MHIGIVEQDELLADLVSFRLELLGHDVTRWSGGGDMLEEIFDTEIDLLIIDTFLPDMQGWEAVQQVRKKCSAQALPILALSIDTDLSLVEQSFKAGVNDYLITPFDPATLQEKTDTLLIQRRDAVRQ